MATNLVTAKAASVITENLKNTLATPGSLSPSQIVAMVGIAQGTALQVAPTVTTAISQMQAQASAWISGNVNLALANTLQTTAASLSSLGSQMLPSGNHAAFGSILSQAQSHISDALDVKKSMNFLANTDFSEFGSGISSMADLTTQGIDKVVGSLSAAGEAFKAAGPLFDMSDIGNFGSPVGLVKQLTANKLANASGLNEALVKAGVDLNDIENPLYEDQINRALSTITDPKTISTITSQFGVTPFGQISSLKDLTDITKLANPAAISGLTGSLSDIASKLSDIGANFADPTAAKGLMDNLEIPDAAALDSAYPSTSSLVNGLSSAIDGITGTGSGSFGIPSMSDFTAAVAGGPSIDSMLSALSSGSTATISAAASGITSMISSTNSLMSKAGIDLTTLPAPSFGAAMGFAGALHGFGADSAGSGVGATLANMAAPGAFGDSIKSSLAEGKNKLLMGAAGIRDLQFTDASANPFAGLPSAGEVSQGPTFLTGSGSEA